MPGAVFFPLFLCLGMQEMLALTDGFDLGLAIVDWDVARGQAEVEVLAALLGLSAQGGQRQPLGVAFDALGVAFGALGVAVDAFGGCLGRTRPGGCL